jgi:hypothetical protein
MVCDVLMVHVPDHVPSVKVMEQDDKTAGPDTPDTPGPVMVIPSTIFPLKTFVTVNVDDVLEGLAVKLAKLSSTMLQPTNLPKVLHMPAFILMEVAPAIASVAVSVAVTTSL